MAEAAKHLTDEEKVAIANGSFDIFFEGYPTVLRSVHPSWGFDHSEVLRERVVIPTAILGIDWGITVAPVPDISGIGTKAKELSAECDLSFLNRLNIPEYNIAGVRSSIVECTVADATRVAMEAVGLNPRAISS